jgi:hypothetical protein
LVVLLGGCFATMSLGSGGCFAAGVGCSMRMLYRIGRAA